MIDRYRCGNCGNTGHNRRRCRAPSLEPPPKLENEVTLEEFDQRLGFSPEFVEECNDEYETIKEQVHRVSMGLAPIEPPEDLGPWFTCVAGDPWCPCVGGAGHV